MQCIIFSKQEPLCTLWLASHNDKRIKRNQVCKTDIEKCCKIILHSSSTEMALQMRGQLMLGIVRLFFRKVRYYLSDINDALMKLKLATDENAENPHDEDDAKPKVTLRDKHPDRIKIKFDLNDNDLVVHHRPKQPHLDEITIPQEASSPPLLRDIDLDRDAQLNKDMFRDDIHMDEESMAMSSSFLKSILDEYMISSPKQADISAIQHNDITMQTPGDQPEIDISIQAPNHIDSSTTTLRSFQTNLNDTTLKLNNQLEILFQKAERTCLKKKANAKSSFVQIDSNIELEDSDRLVKDSARDDSINMLILPPYDRAELLNNERQSKEYLLTSNEFQLCSTQIQKILEDDVFLNILHKIHDLDIKSGSVGCKRSFSVNDDKQIAIDDAGESKRHRSEVNQQHIEKEMLPVDTLYRNNSIFDNHNLTCSRNELPSMDYRVLAAGGDFPNVNVDSSTCLANKTREINSTYDTNCNSLLSTIANTLVNANTSFFSTICPRRGTNRRSAARSFALILELNKANAISLNQNETYGEIEIGMGDLFNNTFKSLIC
ncbi:hypothetical protein GJ496_009104 [Pomphorhynchus laevis]|nr:hypothetical protein GJ496_009104 [Pomphorhynchus laevis]